MEAAVRQSVTWGSASTLKRSRREHNRQTLLSAAGARHGASNAFTRGMQSDARPFHRLHRISKLTVGFEGISRNGLHSYSIRTRAMHRCEAVTRDATDPTDFRPFDVKAMDSMASAGMEHRAIKIRAPK